jgi:Mn-dependent DtxR family transcriptional regulator
MSRKVTQSDEVVCRQIAEFVQKRGKATAWDIAHSTNISLPLAKEQLLVR